MTQLLSGARFLLRYRICASHDPWMQAGAAALRNRVFVQEQRVFTDHDRDAIDEHALPLVAIDEDAAGGPLAVGTVRIHEAARSIWWGRVWPWRRVGKLRAELIRLAVGTARAPGCARILRACPDAECGSVPPPAWDMRAPRLICMATPMRICWLTCPITPPSTTPRVAGRSAPPARPKCADECDRPHGRTGSPPINPEQTRHRRSDTQPWPDRNQHRATGDDAAALPRPEGG